VKFRERMKLFRVAAAWPNISLDEFAEQMRQAAEGQKTRSGVDIGPTQAMGIAAFFCGVNLITGWMASCKCILYERIDETSKRRIKTHPLYSVLHDRFSPTMTAYHGWRTLTGHLVFWGNAFAIKIRDPYRGILLGLRILHPSQVKTFRVKGTLDLYYEVKLEENTRPLTLTRNEIFHIPGPGFNGMTGFSVLSLARNSLGLTAAMEQYGQNYFGSGIQAGGFIERPLEAPKFETSGTKKRLEESISQNYSGPDKQGKFIVLEEGMKFKENTIPLDDAQFLVSRTFQIQEIARWLNLPPHKLKELSRATFSNIEHQQIENIQDNLQPWAALIESEICLQLIEPEEQSDLFAEFLLESLLRGDMVAQNNALAIERQWGIINADEWRAIKNRNPQPDGQGEKYLVPSNYTVADKIGELPNQNTDFMPGREPAKPEEPEEDNPGEGEEK